MTGYNLRAYTPAAARAVASLVNADSIRANGFRRAALDACGNVRLSRVVPALAERVVAVEASGNIAGFAYCADREHALVFDCGCAVSPDQWGRGLGAQLLTWAEGRAAALAGHAALGLRAVLQAIVFEKEIRAGRELRRLSL